VHGTVPAEHTAQHLGRKGRHERKRAPTDQTVPFRRAAVRSLHQQADLAGPKPLPHRVPSADSLAAAAGDADEIPDPAPQAVLNPHAQVEGDMHGAARRPGKGAASHRAF
jgi:hypothetical protein